MINTNLALDRPLPASLELNGQIDIILRVARRLAETDIPTALSLTEKAIALATQGDWDLQPLDQQLAECFHVQGELFLNRAEYRAGLVCFSKAQSLYEALNDPSGAAVELCFIGVAQAYVGLYPDALRNMFEALNVFETIVDHRMLSLSLNGIGYTYVLLDEPAKGLPYLLESERIARETNPGTDLVNTLGSLSRAYLCMGEGERALECSLESVRVSREVGVLIKEAENLLGLGSVYLARHELVEAEACFQDSLVLARKHGYRFTEAGALRRLGQAVMQQSQTKPAISFMLEALAIAQEIGAKQETYLCLSDLAAICKEAGDFEAAFDYYQQFHSAKQSLFSEQAEFRIKSLEIAHELQQATRENEIYYLRNVALQTEVEQRVKAQAVAEQLAIVDSLTGLFNRRHLVELAEHQLEIATRYQRPFSLIMFDVDNFKKINDTFGHAAGDKVLTILSSNVQNSLRRSDVIGRYGGEEFVIILPETNIEAALMIAERIRQDVASLMIEFGRNRISVTISAGISGVVAPTKDDRIVQLIDRADQALYQAKHAGRNLTSVYSQKA